MVCVVLFLCVMFVVVLTFVVTVLDDGARTADAVDVTTLLLAFGTTFGEVVAGVEHLWLKFWQHGESAMSHKIHIIKIYLEFRNHEFY